MIAEFFFNPLGFLVLFTLIASFDILLAPDYDYKDLRLRVLLSANFVFFLSSIIFYFFDPMLDNVFSFRWSGLFVNFSFPMAVFYPILYDIAVDGVSVWYILLSGFLLPLTVLVSWQSVRIRRKLYYFLLFFVTFCLFNVFIVQDLWLFYIFFEIILIPMFILIGVWGSRERRILAAYKFFFFYFSGFNFLIISYRVFFYCYRFDKFFCIT